MEVFVVNPWFNYIKDGIKSIEGRLDRGNYSKLNSGDSLLIKNKESDELVNVEIIKKTKYRNFEEYLKTEGLEKTLPGIKTIEEGVSIYRGFYSQDDEMTYGVLALSIKMK